MFAVSARTGGALGQHHHRFHRHDHAGLQFRLDILAQFHPRLAAIVMRQHAEAVAVTEAAVLQQVPAAIHLVQFQRDLVARGAGPDQVQPAPMHGHVLFPDVQAGIVRMVAEQRPLQRGVIAEDHRKGVQRQDLARPHLLVGDGVVGAVGVDARLEPGPGVHQFDEGKGVGDLADHRVGPGDGDLVFGHARPDRARDRPSADVADPRAFADQLVFFGRFDRPHPHRGLGDVHEFHAGQRGFQLTAVIQRDVVELDPQPLDARRQLAHRAIEIVAPPVGIGDVAAETAPPGLAAVDARADGGRGARGDDHAVFPPERAVEPARIIVDAVIGREQRRIDAVLVHPAAHIVLTPLHLGIGKGREILLAIVPFHDMQHVVGHRLAPLSRFPGRG